MKNVLACNIVRYRKENGLTQEELGNRLGVTYQAVSKWETGQTMPDISILPNLAMALKLSIDKLFGYNAPQKDASFYDYNNVYSSSSEYFWGVAPSAMCLKTVSLLPPNRRLKVLEVGCGEGRDAVFFARCGYEVSAFDISEVGIEKTRRLADNAKVHINAFKADIWDYRLDRSYDIIYSSGVLHYTKPELREEIFENYRHHTNVNGLNAFNVFVQKPFVESCPEKEEHSYLWRSGELLSCYHDWFVEDFSEYIFDCNSSGIPHKHVLNRIFARKK